MPFVTSPSQGLDYVDPKLNAKFFVAAWQGEVDDVKKYISLGADVNFKHRSGHTPAHQAAKFQRWEILVTLIENGVDLTTRDNDDYTPLDLLTDSELQNLLKADVNPENSGHWSKAHELIAQKLEENQKVEAEYQRMENERLAALNGDWTTETEDEESYTTRSSYTHDAIPGEIVKTRTNPTSGYGFNSTKGQTTLASIRRNAGQQPWYRAMLAAKVY